MPTEVSLQICIHVIVVLKSCLHAHRYIWFSEYVLHTLTMENSLAVATNQCLCLNLAPYIGLAHHLFVRYDI